MCLYFPGAATARELTFEDRVTAQEAIERVYWGHRIWPSENPQPKPPFEAAMPEAAIRSKVEDYLKKSRALEEIWKRPITAAHLQAEMRRLARDTRQAQLLEEIFAALHSDHVLIGECLARPLLVDRLIRDWYSSDERFHGEVKRRAEEALLTGNGLESMSEYGAVLDRRSWRLCEPGALCEDGTLQLDGTMLLGVKAMDELHEHLFKSVSVDPSVTRAASKAMTSPASSTTSSALLRTSPLIESETSFTVTMILQDDGQTVRTLAASWQKVPFSTWWRKEAKGILTTITVPMNVYELRRIDSGQCTDDTWKPTSYDGPSNRNLNTTVWTGSEMIVWGGHTCPSCSDGTSSGGRYDPLTNTWKPTGSGSDLPSARQGHSAVWTGTEMCIWGGADGMNALETGACYDPITDSWRPMATGALVPIGRTRNTVVWTGSEIIVWGGNGPNHELLNSGGRYSPVMNTWQSVGIGANTPPARANHTAVWSGSEMVIWGGQGAGGALNTGGRYDPVSDSWRTTSLDGDVPEARRLHSAIWTGSEMIVWGGDTIGHNLNSGGRYDPSSDTWQRTSLGENLPMANTAHVAVWTGSEMIVWGSSLDNRVGRYTPSEDRWIATSASANAPSGHSGDAAWTGTEMIIWDGNHPGGRYDPTSDTWVRIVSNTGVPKGAAHHSAVWTGTEMILWGGQRDFGQTLSNTGVRYLPSTDSWDPIESSGTVATGRAGHTAVWTGQEMIIWGGYGGSALNSGGRYNPATDGWAPTSVGASVPGPRSNHSAVWTGSEMIVWGGDDGNFLQTGGKYDPWRDSWEPTSTGAGSPSARRDHVAVWTGQRMIIWSGSGHGGGLYDPRTDSWQPTSMDNLPPYQSGSVAVWTGTEMLAWGGNASSNIGARYNPQTDSWSSMSATTDVTPARTGAVAVWTGSEMLVWGGSNEASVRVNSGGRYDPVSDSWRGTSLGPELPSGRYSHTSIWTGEELIVWGGFTDEGETATGGRYCAAATCPGGTPETCDGVDNDCNGSIDDVPEGCALYVTNPVDGATVDCRLGAAVPVITWNPTQYDRYRVFVSSEPSFLGKRKITSGKKLLSLASYTFSATKWKAICAKATSTLYVKVLGMDLELPKRDPLKKHYSPIVALRVLK